MNDLAIAYVTCDKYSHVWEEWYEAFKKNWDVDAPVYWCGEEKPPIDDKFKQIPHKPVDVEHWAQKLRTQIVQIPEKYIHVWMDDGIPLKNISKEFMRVYRWLHSRDGDSMRIMYRDTVATYQLADYLDDNLILKLTPDSHYRVSFGPVIYKKSFLLEALSEGGSPWAVELNSHGRFTNRNIFAYHIRGWILNKVVR